MDENILSDLEYPMSRSKMNARNIEDIIDDIKNIKIYSNGLK